MTTATLPGTADHRRLHRPHGWALIGVVVVTFLAGGSGWFAWRWTGSRPAPVSVASALERFRTMQATAGAGGPLQPRAGVYRYTAQATEHVSLPPKTVQEGPVIPVTVTRLPGGCWQTRVDLSDSHWEGGTFCSRNGSLYQVGRGGWMRWDFVVLVVEDTSTFRCSAEETVIPAEPRPGASAPFSCVGTNDHLSTGPVTMAGTSTVVGGEQLAVSGRQVPVLHVRENATFSGGQSGAYQADIWFGPDGLPLRERWSTQVRTASPVGTTTMTGGGDYRITSLTPRS
ncbi:MAG TPA: hypothetical protein VFH58_15010 [Acidimicrobiales bacterium]|nr:hypothetical protein [Acidimicrobiales bacterium]